MNIRLPISSGSEDQVFGYKIIGDNIDKNVHSRFHTLASPTKSLHYFHAYAVKDRIDTSKFSDIPPSIPNEVEITAILPTPQTNTNLREVFEVLVARSVFKLHGCKDGVMYVVLCDLAITCENPYRILVSHVPVLAKYRSDVTWHIPHKFSSEMSLESEIVSIHISRQII